MSTPIPDFPDWATPVGVLDRATLIGNSNWNVHRGQGLSDVDTSRYSSLGLAIALPGSLAGQRYMVQVNWKESSQVIDSDSLSFHSSLSYAALNINNVYWHMPVRGSSFDLSVFGSDVTTFSLYLIGSTRELTGGRATVTNDAPGRGVLDQNFGSIAAAGSSPVVYVPPVARAVRVRSNQRISSVTANLWGLAPGVGTVTTSRLGTFAGDVYANTGGELTVVNTALEVQLTNGDTVAHSLDVQVWDVS